MTLGAIAQLAQDRRSRRRPYRGSPRNGAHLTELGGPWPGQQSTNHPFAHGRRRMMSRSIGNDPGRRRWASQTVGRSLATIDHSENARTGTAARGREASSDVLGLRGTRVEVRTRDTAAPSELGVVNLITHHDEEANEQLASYGHAGLRATAAMEQGAIEPVEVVIGAGGQRGGLAEDPTEQRASLFGDLPEVTRVRRGAHGRGQAHVAHDVLAPREAGGGPSDQDGGESGQGAY